jgi:hypothetical protein
MWFRIERSATLVQVEKALQQKISRYDALFTAVMRKSILRVTLWHFNKTAKIKWVIRGESCKDSNYCFVTAGTDSRPIHASSKLPSTLIQTSHVHCAIPDAVFMAIVSVQKLLDFTVHESSDL